MNSSEAAPRRNPRVRLLSAIPESWIRGFLGGLDRLADGFVHLGVSPNRITLFALLAGLAAGAFFAFDFPAWAVVLIFICGALDVIDGKVAVKTGRKSLYGAIFDSTLDRYSEFFIYFGLAYYFRGRWPMWIPFFTFLGSTMVSYTRARAEGLGIECRIGFMQRAERMILLVLGTLIGIIFNVFDPAMIIVLTAIAVVSNITAIDRTLLVRKIERQMTKDKEV
ncbi:MAG: CDP-alcohol phosphatidyltransferase family protein [Candidatus Aminicenantes bacterium]|nr:CDP-alcohol phosphatidyltransferase family protein [Candidatus Aminicenantes bacterium]